MGATGGATIGCSFSSLFSSRGAFPLGGLAAARVSFGVSFWISLGSGFLNFFKASASCAFLTVILRFLANF
jgi:hypothetical protein